MQVAAERELPRTRRVLPLLRPDGVQRRTSPPLPPVNRIEPKRLEVEVGIVERRGRHITGKMDEVERARLRELFVIVVVAGGDERLHEQLERDSRRDHVIDARLEAEFLLR